MNRPLLTTLCAAALALAVTAAFAAPAAAKSPAAKSPTKSVRSANGTISKLLRAKVEAGSAAEAKRASQVTTSLRDFLDVDELGKLALVDHWKGLTETQQKDYLELLRALIEANYIKGLRANLDYKVKYVSEEVRDDTTVVATEINTKRKGRPIVIAIDYVLRKDGSNWRAIDVVTDGVGLVENYRAQFNRIISKESFDGLLDRMRQKLKRLKEPDGETSG